MKFVLPKEEKPGLYAVQMVSDGGAQRGGRAEPPGPAVGAGRCRARRPLPADGCEASGSALGEKRHTTNVLLKGPQVVRLKAQGDCYALRAALPKDLPTGRLRGLRPYGTRRQIRVEPGPALARGEEDAVAGAGLRCA